ncbi:methylated-DNA--[protein]-cysteine S-methyltransferase [Chloroflexota bacterium]
MSRHLNYTIFKTNAGWVGISASPRGLTCLTLPQNTEKAALRQLGEDISLAEKDMLLFDSIMKRLIDHFTGHRTEFQDELDLSGATEFQRRVWQTARKIPHGETRTYKWLAEEIQQPKAARAVGQALGKNPLPIIIPCHRVLAHDGSLGGFTGGIEWKKYLLKLERQVN